MSWLMINLFKLCGVVGIEEDVLGGKGVAKYFKLSLKLTLSEISEDLISITDNSFCK